MAAASSRCYALDDPAIVVWAHQLTNHERAGNVPAAFRVISNLSKPEAQAVALVAGHRVTSLASSGFWRNLQAEISEACRTRQAPTVPLPNGYDVDDPFDAWFLGISEEGAD